jgi:hypothetical protein
MDRRHGGIAAKPIVRPEGFWFNGTQVSFKRGATGQAYAVSA